MYNIYEPMTIGYDNRDAAAGNMGRSAAPQEYATEFPPQYLPEPFTDQAEARVFADLCRPYLCFTDATGYLYYDGKRWREEAGREMELSQHFADMQLEDAREEVDFCEENLRDLGLDVEKKSRKRIRPDDLDPETAAWLLRYQKAVNYEEFALKYQGYRNKYNMLEEAKAMIRIPFELLDGDPFLLNTPDGTFDLQLGWWHPLPHRQQDYITKITACSPGNEGEEIWQDALQTFFCGDEELIRYVQQIAGLAAIGKVYVEALVIAYGDGRNGKSTFWNTIHSVLGDYAGHLSADVLVGNPYRNTKPEQAELKGKRLVIAAELDENRYLNTSLVKQLCSTDVIYAEKKYKAPSSFEPSHTLILYTNHLPRVSVGDEGTWRRLIVIPFHAVIEGESDIKNYSDYLVQHAGPAVLKWVMEGARSIMENQFHLEAPKAVQQAILGYRSGNDWLTEFVEECCILGDDREVRSGELYQRYRMFCGVNGEKPKRNSDFNAGLHRLGLEVVKKHDGNYIKGISLQGKEEGAI